MKNKLRYWDSPKGIIIKAITINGAHKWKDICDSTKLSSSSLKKNFREMFNLGILFKRETDLTYWVSDEIYKEYKRYFAEISERQKEFIKWVDQWGKIKKLDFSLEHKHFFLEGKYLDDIVQDLIRNAKEEILVVNPFVEDCDLSNALREVSNGIDVKLITRSPDLELDKVRRRKKEYHKILKDEGTIMLYYNEKVHAKLVTIDRAVAVTSSMNFHTFSIGGGSWEAGIVTVDETVVTSIVDSILGLLSKPESKKMII